jgi:uncharacterized membrane protein YvlD (DUF360 family)
MVRRLFLHIILTALIVAAIAWMLPSMFAIATSPLPFLITVAVITLCNAIARPILDVMTFPLRPISDILATTIVNLLTLWLAIWLLHAMSSSVPATIGGGWFGWLATATLLGIGHWIIGALL